MATHNSHKMPNANHLIKAQTLDSISPTNIFMSYCILKTKIIKTH